MYQERSEAGISGLLVTNMLISKGARHQHKCMPSHDLDICDLQLYPTVTPVNPDLIDFIDVTLLVVTFSCTPQ